MRLPNCTSIVGEFGSGKTLLALELALFNLHLYKKNLLVTNFPLNLYYLREYCLRKRYYKLSRSICVVQVSSVLELPAYRNAVVVVDEGGLFFSARNWSKLANSVACYLSQLRKFNVNLLVTYQYPEQVDKLVREFSQLFAVVQALKVYDSSLNMPRLLARSVYFYNQFKFNRYCSDLAFRSSPLKPRFAALKVWDNFPIFADLRDRFYSFLFRLGVRFRRQPNLYQILFRVFDSSQILSGTVTGSETEFKELNGLERNGTKRTERKKK